MIEEEDIRFLVARIEHHFPRCDFSMELEDDILMVRIYSTMDTSEFRKKRNLVYREVSRAKTDLYLALSIFQRRRKEA